MIFDEKAQGSNVLVPDSSAKKSDRFCELCRNRFTWVNHWLVCGDCGNRIHEDETKTEGILGAKSDPHLMIVQAEKKKRIDDLPEGAVIVREWDLD